MTRKNLPLLALSLLISYHTIAQWGTVTGVNWVGSSNVNTYPKAYTVDANGNQYLYYEPTGAFPNVKARVGKDTITAQRAVVKLDNNNHIIWKLDMTNAAATFTVSKIVVDASGNVYIGGNGGPASGGLSDTTQTGNNIAANKNFLITNAVGNTDTIHLKLSASSTKGYSDCPFVLKYSSAGIFLGSFMKSGQNGDQVFDLLLNADTLYVTCKGHATQYIAKLSTSNLQPIWINQISDRWQNGSFFGKFAWLPSANRLFTTIPYSSVGSFNNGTLTLTGGLQGYIIEIDPATGNVKSNYKSLSNSGLTGFYNFNGSAIVAPDLNAAGDSTLYFSTYALYNVTQGSMLTLDGLSITKQYADNFPLVALGILNVVNGDSMTFTSLSSIESASTTISTMQTRSISTNGNLYTAYFSQQSNTSNQSSVIFTGQTASVGVDSRVKLFQMNAKGAIQLLGQSSGGNNVPSNIGIFSDLNGNVYVGGTYYYANSALKFNTTTVPLLNGGFIAQYITPKVVTAEHEPVTAAKNGLVVYPNPATDQVNIVTLFPVHYSLTSLTGNKLQDGVTSGVVSLQGLSKGVYLLQINGKVVRLVKE